MERLKTIYAESIEELSEKTLGLYHDHCWHLYAGPVKSVPDKYKDNVDMDKEGYVFLYYESSYSHT